MGHINILDENMINMIAAGEVIERPASVVKELMENSIDAGATRICVTLAEGGKRLISVQDNGCGMDAEDLGRAFGAHATSKIKHSTDLNQIATLGFRGEALASIASIALVKAVSRPVGSDAAHAIEIDCGTRLSTGPGSGDYGTMITVRDLFYKLPARRKFLRTTNTEMGHVTEQFTRIALAHNELDLTLVHNNRDVFRLGANQSRRTRVGILFGALAQDMQKGFIEVQTQEKGVTLDALVCTSQISRANNKLQYCFLNGRFIKDRTISHAIREAYRGLIEPNRHPVVFLFLTMPYEDYDVNVHPTKVEVRFYHGGLLHSQILGALREALLSRDLNVSAKLPGPSSTTTPQPEVAPLERGAARSAQVADAMAVFFKEYRAPAASGQFDFKSARAVKSPVVTYESVPDVPAGQVIDTEVTETQTIIQIHDSYIVAQTAEGFVIIDQHALHEKILYEKLMQRVTQGKLESQRLLIPETVSVSATQVALIEDAQALLDKLGIELSPFGTRTYAVQAFPTLLSRASVVEFMRDLFDLLEQHATLDPDHVLDAVLSMAACKAAIKAGQRLKPGEIRQLLLDAEQAEASCRCPHGRPSTIRFSLADLEKQFLRT